MIVPHPSKRQVIHMGQNSLKLRSRIDMKVGKPDWGIQLFDECRRLKASFLLNARASIQCILFDTVEIEST
jgi:hypothetical protein